MKILELKTMRGPNYWSVRHHKIIVMKLDLGEMEREPTHHIEGFADRLVALMPTIVRHRCHKGYEGGFMEVVRQGTWMGHVVMHVALELQSLAGMECFFGRTISAAEHGIYRVIFEYVHADAGQYAAEAAVRLSLAVASNKPYDVQADIGFLRRIEESQRMGPSTAAIIGEAAARGIPFRRVNDSSLFVLGYGIRQQKIRATVAGTTRGLGIEIAKDKQETKQILAAAHIPVPKGELVYHEEDLGAALDKLTYPVVLKPVSGNHGRGITTWVKDASHAFDAFHVAKEVSLPVLAEEHVEGYDYRILLVNYKLVAAALRTPASVTGDGVSTVSALIDKVNEDPARGKGHDNFLTCIIKDESTVNLLSEKGLTLDSVPADGERIVLKHTANISTGGTAEDVTDEIHPYNVRLAERVARLVDLDICGLDVIAKDLSKPLTRENGAIVEVNAGPGLRMHLAPARRLPRNIGKLIVDMLFPEGDEGRIPLVAVTGTNGKTTTTRLIAHIAQHAGGKKVGFTTTDGIYINGELIYEGDCTGPVSSEAVLFDPTVDFAVLECARGGMLRAGLAFDSCDIAIVTNVSADHLGLKDIGSVEEMARVKRVLPETVKRDGYAILNADDDLVYNMREHLSCRIALFSMSGENERVLAHCAEGGFAAIIENGYLTICEGKWRTRIGLLNEIPLTLDGRAEAMISNLLPAALAGVLSGFTPQAIGEALATFVPSADQTPGRMNIFQFHDFQVMVDYAHNPHGMTALRKFIESTDATRKVGIIGIAGDRRDEDIRELSAIAASTFDEIIVRHDVDLRGRDPDQMTALLLEGIRSEDTSLPVKVILDEKKAVEYAIRNAVPGSFITVCSEKVKSTIAFIKEEQESQPQRTEKRADRRVIVS